MNGLFISFVLLVKKRAVRSDTSKAKLTSAKLEEHQIVLKFFSSTLNSFVQFLDLKPVLEKREVIEQKMNTLRKLGAEYVVISLPCI